MVRARMTVGTASVLHSGFVRRIHLAWIMAAEPQTPQRLIRQGFNQLQQARVAAKEKLPDVVAGGDHQLLVFSVDHFAHALDQQAFRVALENGIPLRCPTGP